MTKPLENFRIHYKMKPYRVVGKAVHSESLEELVAYEALYPNDMASLWVRPKAMFESKVEAGGKALARFARVSHLDEVPKECLSQIELPNFFDLQYLKEGSLDQIKAYECLEQTDLIKALQEFNPVLVGTYPLGIQTSKSDLDVLCEAGSPEKIKAVVEMLFPDSKIHAQPVQFENQPQAWVIGIEENPIAIEIFIQDVPTHEQRGYRHMIAEARLLRMGGPSAKENIRELKNAGLKTEPAFARYFQIVGDPYLELLKFGL